MSCGYWLARPVPTVPAMFASHFFQFSMYFPVAVTLDHLVGVKYAFSSGCDSLSVESGQLAWLVARLREENDRRC